MAFPGLIVFEIPPSVATPWKLLGAVPLSPPWDISACVRHPEDTKKSYQGLSQKSWLWAALVARPEPSCCKTGVAMSLFTLG